MQNNIESRVVVCTLQRSSSEIDNATTRMINMFSRDVIVSSTVNGQRQESDADNSAEWLRFALHGRGLRRARFHNEQWLSAQARQ